MVDVPRFVFKRHFIPEQELNRVFLSTKGKYLPLPVLVWVAAGV